MLREFNFTFNFKKRGSTVVARGAPHKTLTSPPIMRVTVKMLGIDVKRQSRGNRLCPPVASEISIDYRFTRFACVPSAVAKRIARGCIYIRAHVRDYACRIRGDAETSTTRRASGIKSDSAVFARQLVTKTHRFFGFTAVQTCFA